VLKGVSGREISLYPMLTSMVLPLFVFLCFVKLAYGSRWVKLYAKVFTMLRQKRLFKRGPGRGKTTTVNTANNLHDTKTIIFCSELSVKLDKTPVASWSSMPISSGGSASRRKLFSSEKVFSENYSSKSNSKVTSGNHIINFWLTFKHFE
jgi:hypothetical protein